MYQCDECGCEYEDIEIENDDGEQIRFNCSNGCGETIEYVDKEDDEDNEEDRDTIN